MNNKVVTIISLLIIAAPLFAGTGSKLTWEPVPMAQAYYLEIKDRKGETLEETTINNSYYDITHLPPGTYFFRVATINIENRRGQSSPWTEFTIIKKKSPEKTRNYHIAASYAFNLPLGVWADYYTASYTGASVYFQIPAFPNDKIFLESEIDIAYYRSSSSTKPSTLLFITLGAGPAAYFLIPGTSINYFYKIHAGPAYSILDLENQDNGKSTSIDLFVIAGTGIRLYISNSMFIEPGLYWKTVFTASDYFHDLRISLYAGIKF